MSVLHATRSAYPSLLGNLCEALCFEADGTSGVFPFRRRIKHRQNVLPNRPQCPVGVFGVRTSRERVPSRRAIAISTQLLPPLRQQSCTALSTAPLWSTSQDTVH